MRPRSDSVGAFLWWCVAGAGYCLGMLSILTIGPFVLLATFVLSGFLLWRLELGWAMAGLLTGASAPLFLVAWSNRDGPGDVCHAIPGGMRCDQEWSPWPFVVAALVLVLAGALMFVHGRRT